MNHEKQLFKALKELLMASSTVHGHRCSQGWAYCKCDLAEQLRAAEKVLFRVNNKYRKAKKRAA